MRAAFTCVVLGLCLWAAPSVAQQTPDTVPSWDDLLKPRLEQEKAQAGWTLHGKPATLADVRAAAESGDIEAENTLGTGIATDQAAGTMEDAISWWTKAANQGSTEAQMALGIRYSMGMGVEQNGIRALMWLQMAAQGDPSAYSTIAHMYEHGTGVTQSYEIAADWYKKGAEKGDGISKWALAEFYEKGLGVDFDFEQAKKWYAAAAAQGYTGAQKDLNRIKSERWVPITRNDKDEVVSVDIKTVRRAQYPDVSQPINFQPLKYKMISYTEAWFRAYDKSGKLTWRVLGLFDCRGRTADLVYTDLVANTSQDVTNKAQQVGAEVFMKRIAPETVAEVMEKRVCGRRE